MLAAVRCWLTCSRLLLTAAAILRLPACSRRGVARAQPGGAAEERAHAAVRALPAAVWAPKCEAGASLAGGLAAGAAGAVAGFERRMPLPLWHALPVVAGPAWALLPAHHRTHRHPACLPAALHTPSALQADGTANMLMLNDVAEALGVPRRRLYDVINVFESIEVSWRLFDHTHALIDGLAGWLVVGGWSSGLLPAAAPLQRWAVGPPALTSQPKPCALPRIAPQAHARVLPGLTAVLYRLPSRPVPPQVMRRVGKLMYEWVGFEHLPGLLEQLAQDESNGGCLGGPAGGPYSPLAAAGASWLAHTDRSGPACCALARASLGPRLPQPPLPLDLSPTRAGVPVEDRIRRAPTLIIVNEQGEEIGSGKGNSHSLWVLSRRLVRMLLKQQGPIALTAAAAVLVGPGGVADPSKHRSQTQVRGQVAAAGCGCGWEGRQAGRCIGAAERRGGAAPAWHRARPSTCTHPLTGSPLPALCVHLPLPPLRSRWSGGCTTLAPFCARWACWSAST